MGPQEVKQSKKLYVVGNYRFTGKLLGKGNFARVEEAQHTILRVKVAVKIMDISTIEESYVIKNLCREAKLMAKLNHPCVCALYQTMQRSDNVYYLVTELAAGGDLCTFVKEQRDGKLEERPTRIYARQFASALGHMHHMGVVHRDLKMENVMLNSARTQIKIVDFGLSNWYSPNELLKTHCGSPEYAAPELFVTGMLYGPEVDLWSLGIILYGMVVGQLPFVSNRNENLTSQERRKKLVAKINKGLGSVHRKALSTLSPDFRNMIDRLLMTDVLKRITLKQLLNHPFITEKGTKSIRINPLKKPEVRHQAGIIAEICELTDQKSESVIAALKQEPYSRIGGMYNILAHQMALSRLNGDGITKVQPMEEATVKTTEGEEMVPKRSYSLRSGGRADAFKFSMQENTQFSRLGNRPPTIPQVSAKVDCRRPSGPMPLIRPCTVQAKPTEKKPNYRDLKTPFMTRQAYSVGMTPKTNRPATVSSPIAVKLSGRIPEKVTKNVVKTLCAPITARKKQMDTEQGNEAEPKRRPATSTAPLSNGLRVNTKAEKRSRDGVVTRAQTAFEQKQRSKSEKLPNPRPVTTLGTKNRILATSQSDSKAATAKPQATITKGCKPFSRLLKLARAASPGQKIDKPNLAYGDLVQKNQKGKKPVIYDPIARSIAGYVCNNVPDNLTGFK